VITQGDHNAEAMAMAEEVLISSIEFYLENKRPIPAASEARRGERLVRLPANISAKVLM
jgi:antitoxin HicB